MLEVSRYSAVPGKELNSREVLDLSQQQGRDGKDAENSIDEEIQKKNECFMVNR